MSIPAHIGLVRNIGVLAHVDAGRTTTTERILALTDRSQADGEERGITLTAAATSLAWKGHQLTIVDMPSATALGADARRALVAVDGAVALLDASIGVEPQLEALWRLADEQGVARLVFVNKMDRADADFARAVASIRERLGATPLVLSLPMGTGNGFVGVIDLVRERALTWKAMPFGAAFAEEAIPADRAAEAAAARAEIVAAVQPKDGTTEALVAAIRAAVARGAVVPVIAGSAFRNKGMQPLLDAIVEFLPSPADVAPVAVHEADGAVSARAADEAAPLTAFAFKVGNDPVAGALVFARVFSGALSAGAEVANATSGRVGRVARVLRFEASDRVEVARAGAGDIVALGGLDAHAGDTLTAPGHAAQIEPRTEQVRSRSA
jgi:elongation factor G